MKPSLLIPGKEEGIKALLGVSSDSRAISGGEVQEVDLYQKPHVWLYSSTPGITVYPLVKDCFIALKNKCFWVSHPPSEQQVDFGCLLKMLKDTGVKPTCKGRDDPL